MKQNNTIWIVYNEIFAGNLETLLDFFNEDSEERKWLKGEYRITYKALGIMNWIINNETKNYQIFAIKENNRINLTNIIKTKAEQIDKENVEENIILDEDENAPFYWEVKRPLGEEAILRTATYYKFLKSQIKEEEYSVKAFGLALDTLWLFLSHQLTGADIVAISKYKKQREFVYPKLIK